MLTMPSKEPLIKYITLTGRGGCRHDLAIFDSGSELVEPGTLHHFCITSALCKCILCLKQEAIVGNLSLLSKSNILDNLFSLIEL